MKKRMFVLVLCLSVLLVLPGIACAMPGATQVTLVYPTDIKQEALDICAYAVEHGYQVKCVPWTNRDAPAQYALTEGVIVLSTVKEAETTNLSSNVIDYYISQDREARDHLRRLRYKDGVIVKANIGALFLNGDDLEICGVDKPGLDYTWDDLAIMIERLTYCRQYPRKTPDPISVSLLIDNLYDTLNVNFSTPDWMYSDEIKWAFGTIMRMLHYGTGSVIDHNGFLNTSIRLSKDGPPLGIRTSFFIGNTSTISSFYNRTNYTPPPRWLMMQLPKGPNGKRPCSLTDMHVWTLVDGPYSRFAWEFMRWMLIGEGSKYFQNKYPYSLTAPLLAGYRPTLSHELAQRGMLDVLNTVDEIQMEAHSSNIRISPVRSMLYSPEAISRNCARRHIIDGIPLDETLSCIEVSLIEFYKNVEKAIETAQEDEQR